MDWLIRLGRLTQLNGFVWLIWVRYNGHVWSCAIWTCHRHVWLRRVWPCDNGYIWCRTAGRNRDVSVAVSIDTNSAVSVRVAIAGVTLVKTLGVDCVRSCTAARVDV
ncbi:MAG: hypothetical protein ACLUAO_00395 [Streptococcus sp.]